MADENMNSTENTGGSWSYTAGSDVAVVLSGTPAENESIDPFLAVVALDINSAQERVKQVAALVDGNVGRDSKLDRSVAPEELFERIRERLGELTASEARENSNRLRTRLKNYFSTDLNLCSLARDLREDRVFEVQEQIREAVGEKLIETVPAEVKVKITDWTGTEVKEEVVREDEVDSSANRGRDEIVAEIEQAARHLLEVEPCIDPVDGRELSKLNLNDEIMIRIVGDDSIRKINPALVAEDTPEEYPVSHPVPARVAALKLGPKKGEMKFWVKLKESVYGRGLQPSRARIRIHQPASSDDSLVSYGLYFLLIFMIVFSLSIFLLFLGAPDYFFLMISP